MKATLTLLLGSLLILSTGCATMNFTQNVPNNADLGSPKDTDAQSAQLKSIDKWHHGMLNGMVEISEPKNLYKDCRGQMWHQTTVEFRTKNGLASIFVNSVLDSLLFSWNFFAFYTPWTVEIQCERP